MLGLLTFGLTLVIVDLVRWRFGPQTHSLPTPPGLDGAVHVLGVPFATYKLFVIVFAAVIAGGLVIAWRTSKIGAILRPGVADREMLGLLGIDLSRVFTATFAFGAALAGLAGVVVGPYLSVYPGMDESILVLVLVVVVVGGLGSIEGAIVGALSVGVVNAIGPTILGGFEAASIFAVMAVVLLVRPRGLLGLRQ